MPRTPPPPTVPHLLPRGPSPAERVRRVYPAIRSQPCAPLATVAGAVVLAAVIGLNLGAVPSVPVKILLGISLAVFYGATLGAIKPVSRSAPAARHSARRPEDG